MDERGLRGIAWADDLPQICAEVLAALADRQHGREVLNFNTVDVALDCDEGTVLIQDILDGEVPDVHMSLGRFKELATGVTGPQEVAEALERRRRSQAERRVWPMPPPGD